MSEKKRPARIVKPSGSVVVLDERFLDVGMRESPLSS